MEIFERNMACMKEFRAKLYGLIHKAELPEKDKCIEQIYSVDTVDGNKTLVIHYDNKIYRLNSLYAPYKEAEYWAEQYNFRNMETKVAMFGLGNGIFASEIVRRMGKDGVLFVYEPSLEIFMNVLQQYDLTDLLSNERVILAIEGLNEFDFHHTFVNSINMNTFHSQILCVHPYYDAIFAEKCVWFWKELKDINIHAQTNINTLIVFGRRMIENTLKNMKFMRNTNTIMELKEMIPKGIPAIIVSAGPSVKNNIEYLKKAKGKALIIAVDRILDFLLDEGVEPDLTATIDPVKEIKYFSRRTDITIPLLCFMESNHEILDAHKGRKIICNCSDYLIDFYVKNHKQPPKMYTGSSVATMAFMACVEMGIDKIILVGQDLAYDGNLSHAGSINEADQTYRDITVEGIDGKQIRSRLDWKDFIMWYSDMIKLLPNITVIDAKEKGARINGALLMPLREVIDQYCNQKDDFIFRIDNYDLTFTEMVHEDMRTYLCKDIDVLRKTVKKARSAIKACDILIQESQSNYITNRSDENHRKLNRAINYIVEQRVYRLIDLYISSSSAHDLSELYQFTDDNQHDNIRTYSKSKILFEEILKAVDYIEPMMEQKIKELDLP